MNKGDGRSSSNTKETTHHINGLPHCAISFERKTNRCEQRGQALRSLLAQMLVEAGNMQDAFELHGAYKQQVACDAEPCSIGMVDHPRMHSQRTDLQDGLVRSVAEGDIVKRYVMPSGRVM